MFAFNSVNNVLSVQKRHPVEVRWSNECPFSFPIAVSDMWSGIVSGCPPKEGDNVTIGCFVQYDWLSTLLQYNPIGSVNASIEFMEDPSTKQSPPPPIRPFPGPPPSEVLFTTYTIPNVQAGDVIQATCRIAIDKTESYSPRNEYAVNSLQRTRTVSQPVTCECSFTLTFTARRYSSASSMLIYLVRALALLVGRQQRHPV